MEELGPIGAWMERFSGEIWTDRSRLDCTDRFSGEAFTRVGDSRTSPGEACWDGSDSRESGAGSREV